MLEVEVRSDSAREVAELLSIKGDLDFVVAAAERLIKNPDLDIVLQQALWSSAIVAYARCFGSGRRPPLTSADLTAAGVSSSYHESLQRMRDKHIAHMAEPFESATISVGLTPRDESPAVIGVGMAASRWISDDPVGISRLRDHASRIREHVWARMTDARRRVMREAQQKPIEELYAEAAVLEIPDRWTWTRRPGAS
jgi:hypothetical protein